MSEALATPREQRAEKALHLMEYLNIKGRSCEDCPLGDTDCDGVCEDESIDLLLVLAQGIGILTKED
ncbi:MAG: hypothetical protein PHQ43_10220 [Dehalococcoidales bacterium]|nr:hypothetical protein [Dehalococcoidales bacterium]